MDTNASSRILSHGTLEIRNVEDSMRFYRDFLGMKVAHHVPRGCMIWIQAGWYIVCLETPPKHEMPMLNHFGIDVGSREEVDRWHQRAVEEQQRYGISKITTPREQHGAYQFYLRDRDANWWEIQDDAGGALRIRAEVERAMAADAVA